MINLNDKNISYMILPNTPGISSYLYSKSYHQVEIKSFYNGIFEDYIMAFSNIGNDDLRRDAIQMLEIFNESNINLKYFGDTSARSILKNGSEKGLTIINYNTDSDIPSYILGAQSFSLIESKTYRHINSKDELKNGMIVEYLNNEKWIPRKINNADQEYEKFYKLLIKYGKVRFEN